MFVASGNPLTGQIDSLVKAQGESLKKAGMEISYFPILKKGPKGYLNAALDLRRYLSAKNDYDLVHSHYVCSGVVSRFGCKGKPVVLSLMGDDAYGTYIAPGKVKFSTRYLTLVTLFIQPFVKAIISKAENIDRFVYRRKIAHIIPNGVDLGKFAPVPDKSELKGRLGLDKNKIHILFLGDTANTRKNFALLKNAIGLIDQKNVEILAPFPVCHDQLVNYYNAADVFAATAFMEGSPNVVKEAMACNCPVVTTDVGDVRWVIGETEGCFVSGFNPAEFAGALECAIQFASAFGRTNGRDRLISIGLNSDSVAERIRKVYDHVVRRNK